MNQKRTARNFLTFLIAGLVSYSAMLRIGGVFLTGSIPITFTSILASLFFAAPIIFFLIWNVRKSKDKNENDLLSFGQGIIRYFVALDLLVFGWEKIFKIQMALPLAVLDEPFSSMSDPDKATAFFGHSYPYAFLLGAIQITGAILLLFRRTRLLALFILLPVMINIILIDLLFHVDIRALLSACILLIAMLFLLLPDFDRVMAFFLKEESRAPSSRYPRSRKNIIRFTVVAFSLAVFLFYRFPGKYHDLTGKYLVRKMIVNTKEVDAKDPNDNVPTIVYFESIGDFVFEYESQKHRKIGAFIFNDKTRQLEVFWRYPHPSADTLKATLSPLTKDGEIRISGSMGADSITLVLIKTR